MKPIGVFRRKASAVQNVWRLCFLLLLTLVYWIVSFLSRFLIAISCLTLQCARGTNVLSKKTAGVICRLLTDTNHNSPLRPTQKQAASISGT